MKERQSPGRLVVLLMAVAFFAFTPGFPVHGQQMAQQVSKKSKAKQPTKTYLGTIMQLKTGQYALVTSKDSKGQFSGHLLDDQVEAKEYAGKKVLVTGILDPANNTIHVTKIVAP